MKHLHEFGFSLIHLLGTLFVMILWKSLGHYKLEHRTPISALLVRDGALSYLVILGRVLYSYKWVFTNNALVALLLTGFGVFIENVSLNPKRSDVYLIQS